MKIIKGKENPFDYWFNHSVTQSGKETFYRRRISLGMVVTRVDLPSQLCKHMTEIANTYAIGAENAACALSRTCLEYAMNHIADDKPEVKKTS